METFHINLGSPVPVSRYKCRGVQWNYQRGRGGGHVSREYIANFFFSLFKPKKIVLSGGGDKGPCPPLPSLLSTPSFTQTLFHLHPRKQKTGIKCNIIHIYMFVRIYSIILHVSMIYCCIEARGDLYKLFCPSAAPCRYLENA